jgi:hypothetical protein
MGAYSFSGTAASNTTVDGIGAAGSDSPDNIDNLVRALAASDANLVRDLGGANTVTGTDTITVALADASTPAYFDGMTFSFRAANDTTSTTPTLNVDSLGAKTIAKAVQGVETALIAGDIQAGQTCHVVYRSAWAAAAGAFELLNPSIASSIELGHATDTTLTRDQAGVAAVEGKRVLTQNFATVQATTSGTEIDFNSIPSWVREIDIMFDGVSMSGSDTILIRIGDSGGIETTSYVASWALPYDTFVSSGTSTAGFPIPATGTAEIINGIMSLKNITGNVWIAAGMVGTQGIVTGTYIVGGSKTLSATLDRVRITRSGSSTFDAGQMNICYR